MNRLWHRSRILSSLTLLLSLTLTACGGGGGDGGTPTPVPDANPTGYYDNRGTASVMAGAGNTQVAVTDLQGVIHNNRLMMLSAAQDLSYDGSITVSGNSYSGTLSVYFEGAFQGTAPVTGTISEGTSVSGTLTGAGAGNGSFQLLYAANNGEAAALSVVGRNTIASWFARVGGSTSNMQIVIDSSTGEIVPDPGTANDGVFAGCQMSGTITPVSARHFYTVSAVLSGCTDVPSANGSYTGLAATRTENAATTNDRMFFAVTNGTYGLASEFFY